jgi:hypothetical protein
MVMQDVFELNGPEGNSIVGNLVDLGRDPLGFLNAKSQATCFQC